jgi:hypothetical protein
MEKIWNELNHYLQKIGEHVSDYDYKLIFDGVMWRCEIYGLGLDGEGQNFEYESLDLNDLLKEIKKEQ